MSERLELPLVPCDFRKEELSPGRFRCVHPRGQNGKRGTDLILCHGCSVREVEWVLVGRSREPLPQLPKPADLSAGRPEPGLLQKAANFARSFVRHVAAGLPQAASAEQKRRLELCLVCPEFSAEKGTCKKCGCPLRKKTSWALERCPLGKW